MEVPTFIMIAHAFDGFDFIGGLTMYSKLFEIASNNL